MTPGGPAPGKRTLTEALPVIQRKVPGDGGAPQAGGGGSPDAGVAGAGPSDAGAKDGAGPDAGTPPPPAVASPPVPSNDMRAFVVAARGQQVQIYVSPGVLTLHPNVFMFFHGYYANYGIDKDVTPKDSDDASGTDTAAAAMAQAKAADTIVMLPQGIRGDQDNDGGRMGGLQPQNKQERKDRNAFPLFVDEILAEVAKRLKSGKLEPRHIALAGHSAGGYKGIQDALSEDKDGKYTDTISDITLMDSSYADSHFESTAAWMFKGSPGKTVRIIQSKDQLDHRYEKDKDNPKKTHPVDDPYWKHAFSEAALRAEVNTFNKKQPDDHKMQFNPAMKFNEDSKSDDRGNETFVIQHSQILRHDGAVQCDILIMRSNLSHHRIRDNAMDDAIDSIGQGEQGNAGFGKNHLPDYGRDPTLSHADDEAEKAKQPPKRP